MGNQSSNQNTHQIQSKAFTGMQAANHMNGQKQQKMCATQNSAPGSFNRPRIATIQLKRNSIVMAQMNFGDVKRPETILDTPVFFNEIQNQTKRRQSEVGSFNPRGSISTRASTIYSNGPFKNGYAAASAVHTHRRRTTMKSSRFDSDVCMTIQVETPEQELKAIMKQQQADDIKSNVLEKIKMDKIVQKEILKQQKEAELLGGDQTGFFLFNNETDQHTEDQPELADVHLELDIEDHVDIESNPDEIAYEEFTLESKVPVDDKLEFKELSFDEGYQNAMDGDLLESQLEAQEQEGEILNQDDPFFGQDFMDLEQEFEFDSASDEEDEELIKSQKMKKWSIVYSKKPELIIDKEEYDRVLIELLQSYADFKQSSIDMEKLIEVQDEEIIQNKENRRKIKRQPKKIRKFFGKIFRNYVDTIQGNDRIHDVKLKFDQFRKYVKVVSNYEIELIDGGDSSELKAYTKKIWKALAEETEYQEQEELNEEIVENEGTVEEAVENTQETQ